MRNYLQRTNANFSFFSFLEHCLSLGLWRVWFFTHILYHVFVYYLPHLMLYWYVSYIYAKIRSKAQIEEKRVKERKIDTRRDCGQIYYKSEDLEPKQHWQHRLQVSKKKWQKIWRSNFARCQLASWPTVCSQVLFKTEIKTESDLDLVWTRFNILIIIFVLEVQIDNSRCYRKKIELQFLFDNISCLIVWLPRF